MKIYCQWNPLRIWWSAGIFPYTEAVGFSRIQSKRDTQAGFPGFEIHTAQKYSK